jgi:hypothetical protein
MKYAVSFLYLLAFYFSASQGAQHSHVYSKAPSLNRFVKVRNEDTNSLRAAYELRGGYIPAGWNPFGYKLSDLGERFLSSEGALDCDVGRFLASFKTTLTSGRKSRSSMKGKWLEVLRYAKTEE